MPYDEKLAERARGALRGHSFTEKRMFGGLAFLVNGHMCCGIVDGDLMVRTGPAAYETALAHRYARPMDFTGRPMRGFVFVSSRGLRTTRDLTGWIQYGLHFVSSLQPK